MNMVEHFNIQEVSRLDLSRYSRVASGTTVRETVETLTTSGRNCAFVLDSSRLAGVFTDRDVLTKVVDAPGCWDEPIESVMTAEPHTVGPTSTAMDALKLMNKHYFRNVPVHTVLATRPSKPKPHTYVNGSTTRSLRSARSAKSSA